MGLNVIGAGFGRTGTMSMKRALEQLGQGRCHHMEEVLDNPWQLPEWQALVQGGTPDWERLLAGYGCTVDWPSAHFWRQLCEAHPGARVILTTRPVEDWWQSYSRTIMEFLTIATTQDVPPVPKAAAEMCVDMIGKQTFGTDYRDEAAAKAAFARRRAEVEAAVPADRLLVYEVGSGWAPLCRFLGKPVPEAPFPHSNAREEFFENFSPVG